MGRKRAASESDGNVSEEDDDYKLQDGEADPFASDDDEEEHEMEIDEDDDVDEDELNEELELPAVLRGIPLSEKKKLLQFKESHNQVEYEQEIFKRTSSMSKKIDLERLKSMKNASSSAAPGPEKTTTTKAKAAPKGKGKKGKAASDSESEPEETKPSKKKAAPATKGGRASTRGKSKKLEESEEERSEEEGGEEEVEEEEEEQPSDHGASDESDDLFDSDEEEAISKRYSSKTLKGSKRKAPASGGKKKKAKKRKSEYDDSEDESEDYASESDRSESALKEVLENDNGATDIGQIKQAFKKRNASERDGTSGGGKKKEDGFESISELRSYLQSANKEELKKEDGDEKPADLNDYIKVFLRRDAIIAIMNEPFFADYITGCFVRFSVGDVGGKPLYRLCEILAVEQDDKMYKVPAPNGNGNIETTVRLKLSSGGVVKEKARLSLASNHTVTQDELERHLKGLLERRHQPLTKWDVKVLRAKQKKYKNHTYNSNEISQMIAKRMGLNQVLATEYSTAMETLQKKMEEARATKDFKMLEEVQKTIEKLEHVNEIQRDTYERTAKGQVEINRKMKENNMLRDMKAGMRKRQEEEEAKAKGIQSNAITDPFIRRGTKPMNLWKSKDKLVVDTEREEQEKKGEKAKPAGPTTPAAPATAITNANTKANSGMVNKNQDDDVVIGSIMSIEQINTRVKQRLGMDFLSEFYKTKKEKYLQKVCTGLPPLDSERREVLRGNYMSLKQYFEEALQPAEDN